MPSVQSATTVVRESGRGTDAASAPRPTGADIPAGLLTERNFVSRLREVLLGSQPFGLGLLDIDRFDAVNRGLGRRVGDLLLVAAARRLGAAAERDGYLVARLAGSKFALLAEGIADGGDLRRATDDLLATVCRPFIIGTHRLAITASAGMVVAEPGSVTADEVMRSADVALHWAKADGGARSRWFDRERDAQEVVGHQLALAMPSALAGNEFVLHYQPLADLRTGRLSGFEALARWQHPYHGLIPPDRFIGIAEDTGLIIPLGAHLLRRACEEAVRWPAGETGLPYVSVNLAAAQLRHPSLETTVKRTLENTGLAPQRLQLEITEHSVFDTSGPTLQTLQRLSALGVRVALDDFGTGYSNLASLPRLPLSEIKLAQPFVQGFGDEHGVKASRAFLTSVISLGRSLNLTTTAEGIETTEQADLMRELGCDTGQGWLFGRPLPPERVRRFAQRLR